MLKYFLLLTIISCAGPEYQKQELSPRCNKKSCRQMTTCSEAVFNYLECGRDELDEDEDGQPCEFLCNDKYSI